MEKIKELVEIGEEIKSLQLEAKECWERSFPHLMLSIIFSPITYFKYYEILVLKKDEREIDEVAPLVLVIVLSYWFAHLFLINFVGFVKRRITIFKKKRRAKYLLRVTSEMISDEFEKEFGKKL